MDRCSRPRIHELVYSRDDLNKVRVTFESQQPDSRGLQADSKEQLPNKWAIHKESLLHIGQHIRSNQPSAGLRSFRLWHNSAFDPFRNLL